MVNQARTSISRRRGPQAVEHGSWGGDRLTCFGDHEKLLADLELALARDGVPTVLAVFELAGIDEYRRLMGGRAADELTATLARRFARAIGSAGACYRIRRNELCALLVAPLGEASAALLAAEGRLNSHAEPFLVHVCFGTAFLPEEADSPTELLILADQQLRVHSGALEARERRRSIRSA